MLHLPLSYWLLIGGGGSTCRSVQQSYAERVLRPKPMHVHVALRAPASMSPFWFEKYDWLFPALHAKVSPAFELLCVSVRVINSISMLGIRNVFAS